jgi:hypothetical protein
MSFHASFAMRWVLALILGSGLVGEAGATSYTWSGAAGGSLTDPANWSPSGFANAVGDVCDLTPGCQVTGAGANFTKVTFTAQLNTAASSVITIAGYIQPYTFSNLHLRGGTLLNGSAGTIAGYVTVENDSVLVSGPDNNDTFSAVLSGSANLTFSNRETSGKTASISANNSGYSGTWTLYTLSGGNTTFGNAAGSVGTGGIKFSPTASGVSVTCDTACPWDVDVSGKVITVTYGYGGCSHNGPITLRSAATFKVSTDGSGKNGTLNGKISGSGKLMTTGTTSTNRQIVITNSTNDYSGGTEVLTFACRATRQGVLGTGNVHVDPNAWLLAEVSGVMTNTADIYLDYNGTNYGKLYMGPASVTTTVNRAYVGGTGGWETAVNYTSLTPGNHTALTDPNYLAGNGTLAVVPFVQAGTPLMLNSAISNVTASSVTAVGVLSTNGGSTATITLYWGESDGRTNVNNWAHTNVFAAGQWDSGTFPVTNLQSLSADRNYYCTFAASTPGGLSVAAPSMKFITGVLAWNVTDDTCGASGADTATLQVIRPANCTNEVLAVNYVTSGGAVAGTDYNASPVSGSLTIPAGQASAVLTLTPIFPPFNYGAQKSIVVTVTPGAYVVPVASNASCTLATLQAGTYTWNTASNGANWLNPACWTPAGFVNGTADVCTIQAGAVAQVVAASTFYGRLDIWTGATLNAFSPTVFSNMHFCGGMVQLPGAGTPNLSGVITVDGTSAIVTGTGYNNAVPAELRGSGTLQVTNLQSSGNYGIVFSGPCTNFNGTWDFYNISNGGLNLSADPGNGVLRFGPLGTNVAINTSTHCAWWLDLQGGAVYVCGGNGSGSLYVHSGNFTLASDSILDATTDGYGKKGLVSGPIAGGGRLISRVRSSGSYNGTESLIVSNILNSYSGGTLVYSNILEASSANALGTGNLEVGAGGKLKVLVPGVVSPRARLYLDASSGVRGIMDLSAGTTTVVGRAYLGGTGGWLAPVGYAQLGPGLYTGTMALTTNYLTGSGALLVANPPGTTLFIR